MVISVWSGYVREDQATYIAEVNVVPRTIRDLGSSGGVLTRQSNINLQIFKNGEVGLRMLERRMPCLREGRPDSIRLWDYLAKDRTVRLALDRLCEVVTFRESGDRILTISVQLADSLMAAGTANAFLEEFIRHNTELGLRVLKDDFAYLEIRQIAVEKDLREAEDSLMVFKRRHRGELNSFDSIDNLSHEYS